MTAVGHTFEHIWLAVAIHLWQTTLILLALLLIARTMRNAPARFLNALWWIGFAKIFMPLALLGRAGGMLVSSVAGSLLTLGSYPALISTLAGRTTFIMVPDLLVVGPGSGRGAPVQALFIIITLFWALGAGWLVLHWRRGGLRGGALRAIPLERCAHEMRRRIEKALPASGIDASDILVMTGTGVPAVVGLFRPKIVVPERALRELDTRELHAILLHEDAHRRRYEPLRLALQRLTLTVFFFYPPLWLLIRQLNSSAEMACDEAVLQAGTAAETYTAAITRMLGFGLEESLAVTVLGFGHLSPIQARLDRLEKNRRYTAMKRHRLAICAAVLIVTLLSFLPMSPLADSTPVESEAVPLESTAAPKTSGPQAEASAEKPESVPPPPPAPPALPETAESGLPAPPAPPEETEAGPQLVQESVVLPVYPEEARDAGVQGRVLLEVLIKADGSVTDVVVREGVAGHPELDRSAVDAVAQWKFQPATIDGNPVDSAVTIPIQFRLDDKK